MVQDFDGICHSSCYIIVHKTCRLISFVVVISLFSCDEVYLLICEPDCCTHISELLHWIRYKPFNVCTACLIHVGMVFSNLPSQHLLALQWRHMSDKASKYPQFTLQWLVQTNNSKIQQHFASLSLSEGNPTEEFSCYDFLVLHIEVLPTTALSETFRDSYLKIDLCFEWIATVYIRINIYYINTANRVRSYLGTDILGNTTYHFTTVHMIYRVKHCKKMILQSKFQQNEAFRHQQITKLHHMSGLTIPYIVDITNATYIVFDRLSLMWTFSPRSEIMNASWRGNCFLITGALWEEPPVTSGFPSQRVSNAKLWLLLFSGSKAVELSMVGALWHACDVPVTMVKKYAEVWAIPDNRYL